jgi:hypothetical protein
LSGSSRLHVDHFLVLAREEVELDLALFVGEYFEGVDFHRLVLPFAVILPRFGLFDLSRRGIRIGSSEEVEVRNDASPDYSTPKVSSRHCDSVQVRGKSSPF